MKRAYGILVLFACPALAGASQEACVFQTYGPGTVQIKYEYKTEKGGSGSTFGSGFIVSKDGHIITANHVLEPDEDDQLDPGDKILSDTVSITVGSLQGSVEKAIIIRRDKDDDIALIKIPATPTEWQSLPIGESDGLRVGDRLTGLGFPQSDITVLPEMPITSQNTKVHGVLKPWLQTALSLNKGNSGGPIFDSLGRVVGIAVALRNDGAQLMSFVIPIQYAIPLIEQAGAKPVQYGSCSAQNDPDRQVGERDALQYLMSSICNRGVLQNDSSWEVPKDVYDSVERLKTELERALDQLPTDSAARQPLRNMQIASRSIIQNPIAFPEGRGGGARPISTALREEIHRFRVVFYQNTSQLVQAYALKDNCDLSVGLADQNDLSSCVSNQLTLQSKQAFQISGSVSTPSTGLDLKSILKERRVCYHAPANCVIEGGVNVQDGGNDDGRGKISDISYTGGANDTVEACVVISAWSEPKPGGRSGYQNVTLSGSIRKLATDPQESENALRQCILKSQ